MSYMALQRRSRREPLASPDPLEKVMGFVSIERLLSDREHQIALLVTRGLSNKEIAIELDISPWTVAAHLRRIFTKLDVGRRIELCALLRTH